jgi:hypothetical protein
MCVLPVPPCARRLHVLRFPPTPPAPTQTIDNPNRQTLRAITLQSLTSSSSPTSLISHPSCHGTSHQRERKRHRQRLDTAVAPPSPSHLLSSPLLHPSPRTAGAERHGRHLRRLAGAPSLLLTLDRLCCQIDTARLFGSLRVAATAGLKTSMPAAHCANLLRSASSTAAAADIALR